MSQLIKNVNTTYIPGNPGNPGSPYVPAQPARTVVEEQTTCTGGWETTIIQDDDGQYYFFQGNTGAVGCTTENVLVYYPATGEVAAVPYAPPTAAQTIVSLNQGWNSYARTIGKLLPGAYIEFTVKYGSYAALMAVGKPGMEGVAIESFPYGVMVDTSGIYSFEAGNAVALAAGNTPGLPIRIARLTDGRIVYSVGSEAVKISAAGTYNVYDELYVYGMLYSGYDEVSTSEFKTGNLIAEPSVTMPGSGSLSARMLPRATMDGSGDLLVSFATEVRMNGYGALTAEFSGSVSFVDASLAGSGDLAATLDGGGRASFSLLALQFLASDTASEYLGFGSTELPLFAATGAEATFVPAMPTSGYFNLPFLTVWGDGSETDIGTGATSLPEYQFIASEGEYGVGDFSLPLHRFSSSAGFIADDEMLLMSAGVARSQQTQAIDLVMILNSSGELTSTLSMTREQALALMSVLGHSSSFSMLGTYGLSMLSGLNIASLAAFNIGTQPDLADAAVWVVNLDTSASVRYEQYGFNSFFQRGNDYYGVANDGIYKLSGDTDAGSPISALVEFAKSNFGVAQDKTMPNVYLSASSDGALVLKVVTGKQTLFYTARSSSEELDKHRVDLGRGLQGMYWQFGVMNQNGDDFNVAGMEFLPVASKRRI